MSLGEGKIAVVSVDHRHSRPCIDRLGRVSQVPGANGFMAAHVVDQLVKKGFHVRGYVVSSFSCFPLNCTLTRLCHRTVRSSRLASAKKSFADAYGDKVEITAVDDLVKGDFTEIFKGALVLSQSGSLLNAYDQVPMFSSIRLHL